MRFQYIFFILFAHGSIANNTGAPNKDAVPSNQAGVGAPINKNIAGPHKEVGGHGSNGDGGDCSHEDEVGGHWSDSDDDNSLSDMSDYDLSDLSDPRTRRFLFVTCWGAVYSELLFICQDGMPDSAIAILADRACEDILHGVPVDTASIHPESCPSSPRSPQSPRSPRRPRSLEA
ncbi:hypothetical protein MGG_04892 [Pyricularia oryzae 70-15]|uniref:Uncharacterized protein n=3 Tax=Pyricularia oryzae TaxID=318829 RepID=G4N2R5_PYRO7|nr:uncharacterized protein MGG_04892 [Pyricularia oryzae 70-15]EHA52570.1 hypothetical protein MGG_04892 [Pyricularia oryzae 70-15]ELQ34784.1 hypothetical protein OOU_Y34scaffold00745g59 [Pyricularia oryzae Y34]KAI7930399.1 hypothetical protein M9X92_000836 [Pyricularia oryzae]KAI7932148.1 hypothetical protein M0657_000873 [Pyricularia oryzae]